MKIDKYTLGEVQHKTGSQRLEIQSLADLIEHETDNVQIKQWARDIKTHMSTLTDKLHSKHYK